MQTNRIDKDYFLEQNNYTLTEEILTKYDFDKEILTVEDLSCLLITGRNKKVLVVEDDELQMRIIEDLILEMNPDVQVDWEIKVDNAINRICSAEDDGRSYDLIVSDIAFGKNSSGMELFSFCLKNFPSLDVLMVSAHSRDDLRNDYFEEVEPLEYLQKPLNFNDVFKKLAPKLTAA